MSTALKRSTYSVFGLLWASGCVWWIVHALFPQQTSFGNAPNPWEPTIIRLHGWLAAAGIFLLGWVSARHIVDRWSESLRRPSGPFLAILVAFLVVTGFALYYTTDRLHELAATTHELLGGAGILLALIHWGRNGSRRGK